MTHEEILTRIHLAKAAVAEQKRPEREKTKLYGPELKEYISLAMAHGASVKEIRKTLAVHTNFSEVSITRAMNRLFREMTE